MPDILSVAAEPTRRRILQLLVSGPLTVNDLSANFPVTRSAISQHLGVLAGAGLVVSRKEGRQRIYSEVPSGMAQLRLELERFWTGKPRDGVGPNLPNLGTVSVRTCQT